MIDNSLHTLGAGAGSKNEALKAASANLRGPLATEMASDATKLSEPASQLLKFHGSYQQEDRDLRAASRATGTEKAYTFMVRTRIPGGELGAAQYLAHDDAAGELGNGTLRLTTRQGIQLYGVIKDNLKPTIRTINDVLLTTLAACGDVNRNVMACPAPNTDPVHVEIRRISHAIAERLTPRTRAYHEIWLDGEKLDTTTLEPVDASAPHAAPETEPIYGPTYLPRKFKIAVAAPDDNCVDVFTQDIGLAAHASDGRLEGFTVIVGGGMGMTHGKTETFPRAGTPLAFIAPEDVLDVVETIVTVQRDYGDRKNRKHARMKYLIADRGVEWFRAQVEERLGRSLSDPRPVTFTDVDDHLGWHEAGDGTWTLGLFIENGRIKDTPRIRLRAGLRTVLERYPLDSRLTGQQNILLVGIAEAHRADIEAILSEYGIQTDPAKLGTKRYAMACPALPTCSLALTDAERALPAVVAEIENDLALLGLRGERLQIRMTGCPNGCARPFMGDIGFVGRSKNIYDVFVGGDWANTRLNWVYATSVRRRDLAQALRPLFIAWRDGRTEDETFGDFCERVGPNRLQAISAAVA